MPPVIKKACVNNTEFSYSGKECSPLGKGYAADAEQVGTIMEGRDATMWMVGIKNGVKVWNRVPTDLANDTAVIADLQKPSGEKAVPTKKKAVPKKTTKKQALVVVSESEDEPEEAELAPGKSLSDIKEEPEETPAPAPPPPPPPVKEKKKTPAAAKKKVVIDKADEVKDEVKDVVKDEVKDEVKEEEPKKKVTKKKAAETKEPAAADEEAAKEKKPAAPKGTRAPTDFNLFMKYQLEVLGKENPEMKHKDKFSKAAAQWKELGEDEKKNILVKAKATTAAA